MYQPDFLQTDKRETTHKRELRFQKKIVSVEVLTI